MRKLPILAILAAVSFFGLAQVQSAPANPKDSKDPVSEVDSILSAVPLPELPGRAAELVAAAKNKDREDTALAAVRYTASAHPASIAPLVGSVISALPDSAAVLASTAAKLVPAEASAISLAALSAAPKQAEEITRALGPVSSSTPKDVGPPASSDRGNRPDVPPGLVDVTKPGSIRGNRPDVPPGHVRDPKPGRDPQRRRYGSP